MRKAERRRVTAERRRLSGRDKRHRPTTRNRRRNSAPQTKRRRHLRRLWSGRGRATGTLLQAGQVGQAPDALRPNAGRLKERENTKTTAKQIRHNKRAERVTIFLVTLRSEPKPSRRCKHVPRGQHDYGGLPQEHCRPVGLQDRIGNVRRRCRTRNESYFGAILEPFCWTRGSLPRGSARLARL